MSKLELANGMLAKNTFVRDMAISFNALKSVYDLTLTLSSTEDDWSPGFVLMFHDISSLNLNAFGGGLCQFFQLIIVKLDNGFDRARYEIYEVERQSIGFSFLSFEVSG